MYRLGNTFLLELRHHTYVVAFVARRLAKALEGEVIEGRQYHALLRPPREDGGARRLLYFRR